MKPTNAGNRGHRPRPRRAAVTAAAVLGAALLAAGCGHVEKERGPAPQDRHKLAVDYAKCMRANGVASWPDPGGDGSFPDENGSLDRLRKSAGYQKADAACKKSEQTG